jgi:acyl carrier protein phosphodiesterase
MNFLSHFYFERHQPSPERVLGVLLPDLLKNADKQINLHPGRLPVESFHHPKINLIWEGWMRHVFADKVFHNLPFFFEHTHALKLKLQPLLIDTPIRPSFLSHIGLELLLDHLLLSEQDVQAEALYDALEKVDQTALDRFLRLCGIKNTQFFFDYMKNFMRHRYVSSYRDLDQVAYALIQICKRLWKFDPDQIEMEKLTIVLEQYAETLRPHYRLVFREMETAFLRGAPIK